MGGQIKNRQIQKQNTYTKILDTYKVLVIENGFNNVSTKMISKEANVAQGSIFMHFNSKANLNAILVQNLIKDIESSMALIDLKKIKLNDFVKTFVECLSTNELLLGRTLQNYIDFNPNIQNMIDQFLTSIKDVIFNFIQKSSKNKLSIIDTFTAVDAFWSQINLNLITNKQYSLNSKILITDLGKLNKLFKILFL